MFTCFVFFLGYLRQLVLCPVMLVLLLELLNPCLFLANGRVAVNGHLQYPVHLEQLHVLSLPSRQQTRQFCRETF